MEKPRFESKAAKQGTGIRDGKQKVDAAAYKLLVFGWGVGEESQNGAGKRCW
jgi:hypothetical protein